MDPLARTNHILTEVLEDELLVYDEQRDTACRLNRTAALVWQHANGRRSVKDLVGVLDRLHEEDLLEAGYEPRRRSDARLSRRRFIHRVGAVSTAALALPVVQSIVAPTPAAATSYYYR
jgi:hypothetical protein